MKVLRGKIGKDSRNGKHGKRTEITVVPSEPDAKQAINMIEFELNNPPLHAEHTELNQNVERTTNTIQGQIEKDIGETTSVNKICKLIASVDLSQQNLSQKTNKGEANIANPKDRASACKHGCYPSYHKYTKTKCPVCQKVMQFKSVSRHIREIHEAKVK